MLKLTELLHDKDFCTTFEIISIEGRFNEGVFNQEFVKKQVIGIARPSSADDLDILPEGDRMKGNMSFYTTEPLVFAPKTATLQIQWHNRRYKIVHCENFIENGFFKAIGQLMDGGGV